MSTTLPKPIFSETSGRGQLIICLLKLILYKKSLQFGLKYHASSASLQMQITEHIHYSSGQSIMCLQIHAGRKFNSTQTTITWRWPALYYVGEKLENLVRTNRTPPPHLCYYDFNFLKINPDKTKLLVTCKPCLRAGTYI